MIAANEVKMMNKLLGDVTNTDGLTGRCLCNVIVDDYEIRFYLTDTNIIEFYHRQDCCENVYVEDVCGDIADLIGHQILSYEEVTECPESGYSESATWTFYKIQTTAGHVTIRWCGESNGYYSESVQTRIKT